MALTMRDTWLARLGIVSAATLVAVVATPRIFALDDAYITLHSARVLVSGRDEIFDAPALTGVTSPAHAAIVTALYYSGFSNDFLALRLATMLGVVAYVTAVWAMLAAAGVRHVVPRAAATVVATASGLMIVNLTNGLETGWAMAALVWLIALTASGRVWVVAPVAGILPCLRPDLAPAAGLLLAAAVWRQPYRVRAGAAAIALGVAAPFAFWIHANTGAWLPETMRAKTLFYADGCLPAGAKAAIMARDVGFGLVSLVPMAFGFAALPSDRIGRVGLAAIIVSLLGYFAAMPAALTYNYGRYFYVLVAPWCCWGMASMAARAEPRRAAIALTGLAAATIAMAVGVHVDQNAVGGERVSAATWVDANVPPGDVVLVHDAGVFSELAHRRAIDVVGLKTPSSIEAHARWTWPSCGARRSTALAQIARDSGASYLLVHASWEQTFHISAGLEREGVDLELMRPATPAGYAVYQLRHISPALEAQAHIASLSPGHATGNVGLEY